MSKFSKASRVALIIIMAATLCAVIYIMSRGLGLNHDYDFGAGAYYYADIPADVPLPDYTRAFEARLPHWVYYLLFFVWGALMFALWKWIDKKK